VVRSQLDDTLLRQIAELGGGFFVSLQNPGAMELLYDRGLSVLPKGTVVGTRMRQWQERFQWPLFLALLLLGVDALFPEARRKTRETRPRSVGVEMGLLTDEDHAHGTTR